jgi:Holliday junction resolvasome RuvABC endonuclease subunit
MIITSIDPGSKKLGIACLSKEGKDKPKLIYYDVLEPSKAGETINGSGFVCIARKLSSVIKSTNTELVVLERFGISKRMTGAFVIPKVQAIVEYVSFLLLKKECYYMSPQRWKALIIGDSKAEKKDVSKKILQLKLIPPGEYQDAYDACAMGLAYFKESESDVGTNIRIRKIS